MSHSSKSRERPKRRSRTVRAADPPTMQMTPQRMELLEGILRFGVLSRDQLQRLGNYASRNTVNYALGHLYHAGYIDRHYAPPVVAKPDQDHQALYLLDRKGAKLLAAHYGLSDWRDLGWKLKDNAISWWHLHHRIDVNLLLLAFEEAAQTENCQLTWLSERELRQPERMAKVEIDVPTGQGSVARKRMDVVADAFLELTHTNGKKLALFLECDRGTVDISRRWPPKFLGYDAFVQGPHYPRCFPIGSHTVAVLVVTTTQTRALHLKQACEAVSSAGFFLFATFDDVTADNVLSQPIWYIAHRPNRYALLAGLSGA